VGWTMPHSMRMSVVLPAPLEPSSPIIPVGRSMVTSSRAAGLPRKSLVTWSMETYMG
jgi:hypothetical protein